MACEEAGPAPKHISIPAGGTLNIYWVGPTGELDGYQGLPYHPFVHAMGPIADYMTPCTNGDCTKFDPSGAGWTKIAEEGINMNRTIDARLKQLMNAKPENYYPRSGPGLWAIARLQMQGSRWDVKIPNNLKPGRYIVRNELIALHNPLGSGSTTGPQHCMFNPHSPS
jgi:cellulase